MKPLSDVAIRVLESRYLRRHDGKLGLETPEQLFRRVAKAIASAELCYAGRLGEEKVKVFEEYYATAFEQIMVDLDFLPNSPTLMNAGTPGAQLSACFLLPVDDNIESIFDAVKNMALIFKSGGGVGLPMSRLRQKGALVKSTGGVSSGPVSFMRVYNTTAEVVAQGGKRRGALMGTLRIDHPDIMEFIKVKQDLTQFTSFNLSVAVTDEFMRALVAGDDFMLRDPRDGKMVIMVPAQDIWNDIVECAWKTGEPGLVFIDRINDKHHELTGITDRIEGTNPCVPGDTWTMTNQGPRQVEELVGVPCVLRVNGHNRPTSGFFASGRKPVFRITTEVGIEVEATAEHMMVRMLDGLDGTEKVPLSEIKIGDILPIDHDAAGMCESHTEFVGSSGLAWALGVWFGDGHLNHDQASITVYDKNEGGSAIVERLTPLAQSVNHDENNKRTRIAIGQLDGMMKQYGVTSEKIITPKMEKEGFNSFYRPFLRGFFDTDGSVQGNAQKGYSIRLSQSNKPRLQAVQRMLLRMGILSKIRLAHPAKSKMMPDGNGGEKLYQCVDNYELMITSRSMMLFYHSIGFTHAAKRAKLEEVMNSYTRGFYCTTFGARVVAIEPAGEKDVFDVQVPGANVFSANGIVVGNCGETPLLGYESCNLGSINLANFVVDPFTNGASVDYDRLQQVVDRAVRFLDNVITVNSFPMDAIREATLRTRKIGLGVMGFAEMLIKMGVRYGTASSRSILGLVLRHIKESADVSSAELAAQRGECTCPVPGRRNATLTAIAPTGSISMIAGVTGGIEPMFSVVTKRESVLDGKPFIQVSDTVRELLVHHGYNGENGRLKAENIIESLGSGIPFYQACSVPGDYVVCAHEVPPCSHVGMQAEAQKYVDNAVSKTVNLPSGASRDDVYTIFGKAYDSGCKGVTVYRDGCREHQPMSAAAPVEVFDIRKAKAEKRHIKQGENFSVPIDPSIVALRPIIVGLGDAGGNEMGVGEMRELTPEEALKFQAWLERSSTDSGHKVGTRTPEEEQKFRDPKEEQEFQDWVNSHRYRTSVHQDLKIKPKERPDTLTGHTVKIQTGCGKLYVTVNFGEDGNPVELFARHGKAGVCSQAQCEAIGRLGSMSLRSGVDPQAVVDQLRGITCHETAGMGPSKVLSCADGIAQALIKALTVANPPAPGDDPSATHFKPVYSGACPMCGAGAVREGGCAVCKACGWTKCS